MAFENLSEQIKESFSGIKSQITESESFNRVSEAYNNLPSRQQKLIIILGSLITLILLLNIPIQAFIKSNQQLQTYKEQKQIVERLKVTEKAKSQTDFEPQQFTKVTLQRELLNQMRTFQVSDEQFQISSTPPDLLGIPKQAVTQGYKLNLANLNVRQISRVSSLIENFSDSILITGFRSAASPEDPHYFNTEFKLLNYSTPQSETESSPSSLRGR